MFPTFEILLTNYYAVQFAFLLIVIVVLCGVCFIETIIYSLGRQEGIRYVWDVGLSHSQKEENKLYAKWKRGYYAE